jgi:hypothetical protein
MDQIRAVLGNLLNAGKSPADPCWQDRGLMRRVQTLNGFAVTQR